MVYFTAISSVPSSTGPDNAPDLAAKYENILNQAKPPANAQTGEYTISGASGGDITVGCKDIQGFYGIVFKADGSVTENRAPVNGGPQEVIAPGGFDYQKALDALTRN